MTNKKHLRILFIGNSHTYYHGLPAWVAQIASEEGYECDVTMLAHPGWYLHQHVKEPEVRFNIKYGHYDYVVLQEHSHPFDDIPGYIEAATTLSGWIREAGSKPVIYGTWARKTEKSVQETMNKVNRQLAQDLDALYAAVGEAWWPYKESNNQVEMYDQGRSTCLRAGNRIRREDHLEDYRDGLEQRRKVISNYRNKTLPNK